MKLKIINCILCLFIVGTGFLNAGSAQKIKTDRYGAKESEPIEMLSKKKQDNVKLTFRCSVHRYRDRYTLHAKILRNDISVHIVKPGLKFILSDQDSVILKPERHASCCSDWADGRWFNASFIINTQDIDKLKTANIRSVTIPFINGTISRPTLPDKESAVADMLHAVDGN